MKKNRAQEQLENTLITLLLKKNLHDISVKELTDSCNLSRRTLYLYYNDIYDLAEQIEDDIISDLEEICYYSPHISIINLDNSLDYIPFYFEIYEYIDQKRNYFKALLQQNINSTFRFKLEKHICHSLSRNLKAQNVYIKKFEFATMISASALISIIEYWIYKEPNITSKQLSFYSSNAIAGILERLATLQ